MAAASIGIISAYLRRMQKRPQEESPSLPPLDPDVTDPRPAGRRLARQVATEERETEERRKRRLVGVMSGLSGDPRPYQMLIQRQQHEARQRQAEQAEAEEAELDERRSLDRLASQLEEPSLAASPHLAEVLEQRRQRREAEKAQEAQREAEEAAQETATLSPGARLVRKGTGAKVAEAPARPERPPARPSELALENADVRDENAELRALERISKLKAESQDLNRQMRAVGDDPFFRSDLKKRNDAAVTEINSAWKTVQAIRARRGARRKKYGIGGAPPGDQSADRSDPEMKRRLDAADPTGQAYRDYQQLPEEEKAAVREAWLGGA